jgi:hypothetical protein
MTIALIYDPRYHTFESWASLMVEAFGAQQLEIPNDKTDWQQWACGFNGIPLFSSQGVAIPSPYSFSDWDEWAAATVNAVNRPTQESNPLTQ